ncbi:50S ribosomal protein L6 [Candidatus Nomurabacteria bacterium RIFCSPLOWO2_02_40_28]|uniref:50S ribosomal protein L6 n=3 Tax=Parcubacteria group TaxID=1794811 RepID=A0A0H4TCB3_9BACT|nr:50S ribosomal protein L6, large subunit ribosomal protein L6 [uncultured Parcubacteria bacterium Rifle_16ft_4_minimus_5918]KKR01008.1 MAG: 50S ribosomal protein L6 [Candidatus Nomurabacteria bacterium GW2011_GWD2_39_12]KKR20600.1 MAG: 50S ribosomal protein L6 [Candidatus Nomurabacteria bacterium GW2011_GWC2_39_41]KKR37471.1 MAG: 50S ribosomal protein L6 [Candidatus Nomurabacteria bacterium GW2011_GWE2_40_10]KKR38719.1 MAG: 50S ribosomal protein L6 [Candidatus Nomurabacteria bacterium GW2011_
MSRIGKQEILIPTGVKVTQSASSFGNTVTVAGPKGTLSKVFKDDITIAITDPAKDGAGKAVNLNIKRNDKFSKSLWGTYASHIKNMIAGVETPYQKKLILEGVGFKSDVKGKELHFALGFSHPVIVSIPAGITATAEKNIITISGADKELVGSFTAAIRALKKPEPYKGKGMRYEGEVIRRKQGKKTA